MVKIVVRILFFVLLAASAKAQNSHWTVANADVETDISFMSFPSHDTGYFAGVGSVPFIKHTIDSGQDVSNQKFPSNIGVGGNSVLDMSWPSNKVGYISTGNGLVKTTDGGTNWTLVYTDLVLKLANISFPTELIGYATGQRGDSDTKFFIAKTINGGNTWTKVLGTDYQTNNGRIYFKDEMHGIFFAQDIGRQEQHVGYTTDGMATSTITIALRGFGSLPWFLHWNEDDSWNAGYQGIQRSTDHGTSWAYTWDKSKDTTGDVITACFGGKRAFAFTEMWAHVLESTDHGQTYSSSVLPDSIGPVASAITSRSAYVLGVDFTGHDVLLRTDLPQESTNNGDVAFGEQGKTNFEVSVNGQSVTFTAPAAAGARTIEVMDVLGRSCSAITLPSNTEMARMPRSAVRPGTYFARLGNSCTKFTLTN